MKTKVLFVLITLILFTLMVTSCGGNCGVVCCKEVKYWWGSSRIACKSVSNDDCSCPDGYTVEDILFYSDKGEE